MGLAVLRSGRAMREPVTMIDSPVSASVNATWPGVVPFEVGVICANDGVDIMPTARTIEAALVFSAARESDAVLLIKSLILL